jgi:hypothetical protein
MLLTGMIAGAQVRAKGLSADLPCSDYPADGGFGEGNAVNISRNSDPACARPACKRRVRCLKTMPELKVVVLRRLTSPFYSVF